MSRPTEDFDISLELYNAGLHQSPGHKPGVFEYSHDNLDFAGWDTDEIGVVKLGNPELPIHKFKDEILQSVSENSVTFITAETGAGKSTQVPQFLLEAGYKAVHITQPRRAAARNVFSRIRDEISEVRGSFAGTDMVSYQTAGERDGPEDAPIKVVTDGLHLVRELHNKGVIENEVLILDEVHEWNSNLEVLVAWIKRAIKENPKLRVVVMSATMDAEHLAEYYGEVCDAAPTVIEVPGRTFNVEKSEKPESTVVEEVLTIVEELGEAGGTLVDEHNGILVFEPGKREIHDTIDELRARLPRDLLPKIKLFPLHSKLSPAEQQAALTTYPDTIKIVVSTDVAQTSLTIPDIRYVVDSGYQRRIDVDDEGTRSLNLHPISQADCRQRAGRTGRVSDGYYILTRLNDTTPHVLMEDRDEYPTPEILRTDIARNTLRLKVLGIEIADFDMYHRAARHIMDLAKVNLELLGAMDQRGELTRIGDRMDSYPLCTSSARIMVESRRYSESTRAYLAAIVAAKEMGGLQYFAFNAGKKWQELSQEDTSDMLVQLDIFIAAQAMGRAEMREYDLDINNVQRAREHFTKVARIAGTEKSLLEPPTPEEREDIKKCIIAGYLPSIYRHTGNGEYVNASNSSLTIHREISNRSQITNNPPLIIGDPYRVELLERGVSTTKHLIENVTAIGLLDLESVGNDQARWELQDYAIREGKAYQVERRRLYDIDLGREQVVPADPTPVLRAKIIEHAINNPGAQQRRLRKIKKDLEMFAQRAKDPVMQLTHDKIMELIDEASPDDITTPATIEDNLRIIMSDSARGLHLDDFLSPERREHIIRNSPPTVEIGGMHFKVTYKNRKPVVNISSPNVVADLEASEAQLEDGREILFSYKNPDGRSKTQTLQELKNKFDISD